MNNDRNKRCIGHDKDGSAWVMIEMKYALVLVEINVAWVMIKIKGAYVMIEMKGASVMIIEKKGAWVVIGDDRDERCVGDATVEGRVEVCFVFIFFNFVSNAMSGLWL